ncbi:hypothetical protein [Nocardia sp. NPDC004722]
MTAAHPTTLAGRPISGKIARRGFGNQRPIEDLVAVLDAVFAFPEVQKIQWEQYTPSWNDGEPCEFSAETPAFLIDGVTSDLEDDDDDEDDEQRHFTSAWDIKYGNVIGPDRYNEPVRYPHLSAGLVDALIELSEAFESEKHYVALQAHFGDPSIVTATRDGFHVETSDSAF